MPTVAREPPIRAEAHPAATAPERRHHQIGDPDPQIPARGEVGGQAELGPEPDVERGDAGQGSCYPTERTPAPMSPPDLPKALDE